MKKLHAWALFVAVAVLASFVYAQVAVGAAGTGPRASGFQRLLATSTAATSSGVTAGRTTTRPDGMVPMGQLEGPRSNKFELTGIGTGAAGTTFAVECWAVNPGVSGRPGSGSSLVEDWDLQLIGTFTFTLGTSTGVSGSTVVLSTESIAHQVSWAASGYGTAIVSGYAGVDGKVYSPGSNGQAVGIVGEAGNPFGILFKPYNVTTTTCNVIVKTGV